MVLTSVFWVVYLTHFSSSDLKFSNLKNVLSLKRTHLISLEMVFERGLHWSDLTL